MTTSNPDRANASPWNVAFGAVIAAFGTYFCMYAFRKPFTVATYSDFTPLFGVGFKTILVVAQVFGYMVSKFIGIRFIAEIDPRRRIRSLLVQVGLAELSLLLFAVTPAPYNAIWLFVNGLMLGTIYGLVMGFLEGRRNTEALIAALCASFILADGAVKSVGYWMMSLGVREVWMPFATGLLFVLPLLICCAILRRIPPPNDNDVAARSERFPMTAADRRQLMSRYGIGLWLIVLMFLLVTILRSVRADFAPEIWKGLNVEPDSTLFTRSEFFVGLATLVLNGSMIFIVNNRTAFFVSLASCLLGLVVIFASVCGLQMNGISPFMFMVLLGIGIYLPYIAVHTTVFERFIAVTRDRGNIGFLMYLADAFGYLGYVAVLLARELFQIRPEEGMLPFFLLLCISVAILGAMALMPSFYYFRRLRSTL